MFIRRCLVSLIGRSDEVSESGESQPKDGEIKVQFESVKLSSTALL